MNQPHRTRTRIVIAGGGVAALESLLALRALVGHRVHITLISREREFLYRPVTVAEAFERGEARAYQLPEIVAERGGAELLWDSLASVDPASHIVVTATGDVLEFDALIVATGARRREALPGALHFGGREDVPALRALLDELVEGVARSVAFALPSERIWPLPLYELALMSSGYLLETGADDVPITVLTPEEEPLELFGAAGSRAVKELLRERGITLRCSSLPALLRGRAVILAGGGAVHADRTITLPMLEGPALPGLPHDDHGFIPVDFHGRVKGCADVYAAGDVTAFPLKQGGLAAQQADAVAEAIAAGLGAAVEPKPFTPVLRGLLMTGGAPLYLRAEPQRLPRQATVATDATPFHRTAHDPSTAAGQALWWPPAKVAGRYLAPYLATARPQPLSSDLLTDRVAIPGRGPSEGELEDALELALLLAECDARWGDFSSAINALDSAVALRGALPPEYEAKRRQWLAAARLGSEKG